MDAGSGTYVDPKIWEAAINKDKIEQEEWDKAVEHVNKLHCPYCNAKLVARKSDYKDKICKCKSCRRVIMRL